MDGEERLKIDGLLRLLLRRKGVICAVAVTGTLGAFALISCMRPVFKAETLIEITADKMRTMNIETVAPSIVANEFSMRTEAEKLQSDALISQVVEDMQLV